MLSAHIIFLSCEGLSLTLWMWRTLLSQWLRQLDSVVGLFATYLIVWPILFYALVTVMLVILPYYHILGNLFQWLQCCHNDRNGSQIVKNENWKNRNNLKLNKIILSWPPNHSFSMPKIQSADRESEREEGGERAVEKANVGERRVSSVASDQLIR